MNIPARCPKCARILFPTKDNKIPAHRRPPKARLVVQTDTLGSPRLTGPEDPMCSGEGEPVRKRAEDELTGEAYRARIRQQANARRKKRNANGSR